MSPEQVSGYLKEHHDISLSHETIYRFIDSDTERHASLKPFLRQGHKHRRKRYGAGARASRIPDRVSITERPPIVERKRRLGDWECDTVIGSDRKSVLVTVVDRTSLFTCCSRVYSRTVKRRFRSFNITFNQAKQVQADLKIPSNTHQPLWQPIAPQQSPKQSKTAHGAYHPQ